MMKQKFSLGKSRLSKWLFGTADEKTEFVLLCQKVSDTQKSIFNFHHLFHGDYSNKNVFCILFHLAFNFNLKANSYS